MQGKASSRRFVWLGLAVVAAVAVWSAGWFALSHYTGRAIDRWVAAQAAEGRAWSCEDRSIGGFPFRLIVRCSALRLAGDGRATRLSLGDFRAFWQVYNHRLILVEADGPLTAEFGGEAGAADAKWSHLRMSLRRAGQGLERVSARVRGLNVSLNPPAQAPEQFSLAAAEFHFRPAPDTAPGAGAIDIALAVEELQSAILDRLTGEQGSGHAELVARITRAPLMLGGGGHWPQRLEAWRLAGGQVTVQKSAARQGRMQIEATGTLGLDDQRRPAGSISARAAGLQPLMARMLDRAEGERAGRMRGLMQRLPGSSARAATGDDPGNGERASADPRFVPLPLHLRSGAVWLGPAPTPIRFGPLY